MIRYIAGRGYCVVHAHPKKPGSKTDKPIGTIIHCYPGKKSDKSALRKAIKLHYAIKMSEKRRG